MSKIDDLLKAIKPTLDQYNIKIKDTRGEYHDKPELTFETKKTIQGILNRYKQCRIDSIHDLPDKLSPRFYEG